MFGEVFRRLPPVARRDAVIKALRGDRNRPSYQYKLSEASRLRALHSATHGRPPVWTLNDKASGYRFAMSHGVPVPTVYGEYGSVQEIAWDELPSEIVIKALSGTASQAVFPLVQEGDRYRDLLGDAPARTREELIARLEDLRRGGTASSELLVEELLRARSGSDLDVAADCKMECFHGVVGMLTVIGRRFRGRGGQAYRFFGPDGADLGDVRPGWPSSPSLPAPQRFADLVAVGQKLSAAIMEPYVRIDMYDTEGGIVFGEITPAPGGDHVLVPELDMSLGQLWEEAAVRLERDAIDRGIREPVFGPHEHEQLTR